VEPPPLSLDHDGWDDHQLLGVNWKYQMVPFTGSRTLRLNAGSEVIVYSDEPSVAAVSSPQQDASSSANKVVLRPATHTFPFDVKIDGASVGRTHVRVAEPSGRLIDSVEVSVKSPLLKTYRLWRLRDLEHTTLRTGDEMKAIMHLVAALYLAQANVTLVQVGEPRIILMKDKLHDPIKYPTFMNFGLAPAIALQDAGSSDFDMVSTWTQKNRVGTTIPLNISLCSMQAYSAAEQMREVSTYAHEMCHAFGRWLHTSRKDVMMAGDGSDSCKFDKTDMDTINPTGKWPFKID